METLKGLTDMITSPTTKEAIVMLFLMVLFVKWGLPPLFNFRTRIQKSLEDTYETHITELKEMIETQNGMINTQKEAMGKQEKQLHSISAKLSALVRIMEQYNCKKSPDCGERETIDDLYSLVDSAVCDRCKETSCEGCKYAVILDAEM